MSDEAPDLFMYFGSSVFKMAQNGYWGSLDEGSAWVGDLNPSFKQNMTYEGSLYAYPLDLSLIHIWLPFLPWADPRCPEYAEAWTSPIRMPL